jgi:hypothetical protein
MGMPLRRLVPLLALLLSLFSMAVASRALWRNGRGCRMPTGPPWPWPT